VLVITRLVFTASIHTLISPSRGISDVQPVMQWFKTKAGNVTVTFAKSRQFHMKCLLQIPLESELCGHDMSSLPDIPNAFLAGTIFFSSTAYIGAGTYALYHAYPQTFRYSFFTALNVGVTGGLFTGTPSTSLI
jgi:hypothetical protein